MRNLHSQVRIPRNEFLICNKHILNAKNVMDEKGLMIHIDDYAARTRS